MNIALLKICCSNARHEMTTDRTLATFVKKLMPPGAKKGDPDRPVSFWKELDRLRGTPEDSAVVILRTKGCSWYNYTSCTMCGYFSDINPGATEENLLKQAEFVAGSLDGIKVLKVFTSGSFLDPMEVSLSVRKRFLELVSSRVDILLIESRTEYLTERNLSGLQDSGMKIKIAIGLESSNDEIIRNSINKGSSFSKYVQSARLARSMGFGVRTYLLMKPPFISERAAIHDMIKSIEDVDPYTDEVSVNPTNVQRNTLVEYLWKRGMYRPPRLWSLAKVLLETRKKGRTVISYPTGGNRERGVHNEKQDRVLLDLIVKSSLNQDFEELESYYEASDRSSYERDIELEGSLISLMDLDTLVSRFRTDAIQI